MRFLLGSLAGLALGLAVTPKVFGFIIQKECYPSCSTFTAPFSGSGETTAIDEKTPWFGQIGVNKFDSHGTRTLIQVEIKTIMYFNTSLYFNRSTPSNQFGGDATTGILMYMDLHDNPGLLGQYWGRWGNYLELDNDNTVTPSYPDQGRNGIDVSGIQNALDYGTSTTPLFVEYTYPLFDVAGANVGPSALSGFDNSGPVWEYYMPSTTNGTVGWPQVFYGPLSGGIIVTQIDDGDQPQTGPGGTAIHEYFTKQQSNDQEGNQNELKFTVDSTFDLNVEKQVGNPQYFDYFTEDKAFNKSIKASDVDGGLYRNITADSMLRLFDNQYGGGQVLFDVGANGQYIADFIGGNAGLRQETYAKVAVRVEYTFSCNFCQDPQFGGFQGQSFQVHGYPGSYFNLFSAPSFQMNGRFTYLATGHCKYSHTPCWTHPGTYIDDIAFVVDELLIRVTAGPVGYGYTVLINNEPFHAHKHANESDAKALAHDDERQFIPTKFYDPNTRVTVHLKSPLEIMVRTELVAFGIHNADHFFNVDSQLLVRPLMKLGRKPSASYPDPVTGKPGFPAYPIHGFIGQTWANKKYPNKRQYQGEPDDYVEPRPYATESLFSQYHKQFDDKLTSWDN